MDHPPVRLIFAYPDLRAREQWIKDIIARGNTAVFTNRISGVVKKVREWNVDGDGDIEAFYSTGATRFLCWEALEYELSEEAPVDP